MPDAKRAPIFELQPVQATIVSFVLLAAISVVDSLMSADILLPVGFAIPLALSGWTHSRRMIWVVALTAIAATWLLYLCVPPSTTSFDASINRGLVSLMLLALTVHMHWRLATEELLRERESELEKQTTQLGSVNDELQQREEEVVRQNEELQSQAEELERQTEELRLTNEELASRERALEQLLELARSMTVELSRSQTMDKICEALGTLSDGNASAILFKKGGELEIVCHHGFGHADVQAKFIPYSDSFASLIMSMGQTGYLEDVRLRPELVLPAPKEGEPFISVISTPLRQQGRVVGTIELLSRQPRTWEPSQVTLIESLAAQLSISLHNIELLETIQQERRRFEAAFRTVPFGLAVTDDSEGAVVHLNPAGAALLGVPPGENISQSTTAGTKLRQSISRSGMRLAPVQLPLARALRGEDVLKDELELTLPKGTISLLCSAAPIYDGQGKVKGAVSAFVDVTDIKRIQREVDLRRREAEEASTRKTRFLAAVSHDIRTPANAISLMAELIRRSSATPELTKELPVLAERLQANTRSLMELVSDVLDVARFDSGKVELIETEFSLGDLIADECRQVRPLADDKGIGLVAEPLERPIWLRTDRVKLGRVLGNLLGNAIKFTSRGTVTMSAGFRAADRAVFIRVKDTGIGIADESISQIFDEFAQLHNPERDRSKGTGLGLTICKRLIDVIGGEIVVYSLLNHGSTFEVTLPANCVALRLESALTPPHDAAELRSGSVSGQPLNLRVLLVEDHSASREGTADLLRREGATVIEASTGREALAAIAQSCPSVILLDMMLPDMDGREVLKALQAKPPVGLKGVLVLTGDVMPERLQEVQQFGADALIGKPINIDTLLSALRNYQERTG